MYRYEDRGVSPTKEDVNKAAATINNNLFPGAFCWIVKDVFSGNPNRVLISHADGAGTKANIAYIRYKETGDPSVFRGIAQDSLAMNIDDMATVGCFGPFVLSNTIGRNAKLIDGDVVLNIIEGYKDQCHILAEQGIHIEMCGGETADVGDLVRTIIVDSTVTAAMKHDQVIDCSKIKPHQIIIGLSSFGKASYELVENTGIGTNGFTALRHDILDASYKDKYPETYAPEIAKIAYLGSFLLDDYSEKLGGNIGDSMLSPTRIYSPILAKIVKEYGGYISGIFHNSGGGQTKCLHFGYGIHYIKNDPITPPPIFNFIKENTQLSGRDMARTYNLGSRVEVVCDQDIADEVIAIAQSFGIVAKRIGYTEPSNLDRELTITLWDEDIHFKSTK